MDPQTVKDIADQIVGQTILLEWRTWGIQLALWLIGTAAVTFGAAYFGKRGEHKAIESDFDDLKLQLAGNTKLVTEIAHKDWAQKKWKTARRIQIEKLALILVEIDEWASSLPQKFINDENVDYKLIETFREHLPDLLSRSKNTDRGAC